MNPKPVIDLRSDTVTRPSAAMIEAIGHAELGDDVYGGDPTVRRLEQAMAETVGMEAGLFVTSGTQSNLTALMAHLGRGEEFLVGDAFHIFRHEALGSAVLGGLAPHPLPTPADGRLDPDAVAAAVQPEDIHFPVTRLLCLENTFNGIALPPSHQDALVAVARRHGLLVHLDGARLFNAATALDVPTATLCQGIDSVSVCLSKGLGAPVGSVLCGNADFIERGRRIRKMLGGGLRQAGVLAACGLVALEQEVPRLGEDHVHARRLAEGLDAIDGIAVDPLPRTNMVFVTIDPDHRAALARHLDEAGILVGGMQPALRLVTHRDVAADHVEVVIDAFARFYRDPAARDASRRRA